MTTTILGIVVAILSSIPIYFMAKSNAREAARLRQAALDKAVTDAVEPKNSTITDQAQTISDQRQTIRDLRARIDKLEDDLRGGR